MSSSTRPDFCKNTDPGRSCNSQVTRYHPGGNNYSSKQEQTRNKIENNWPVTDYRRYSFKLNRNHKSAKKITSVTSVTVFVKKSAVVCLSVEMVVRLCVLWCCVCTCGVVCLSSYMSLSLFFFSFLFLSLSLSLSVSLFLFHCTHRDEIRQTSDSTN